MEIERKWLVSGWPEPELSLQMVKEHTMAQGYLCTAPTVRLREESLAGGGTEYILCFKSGKGLSHEEIELPLACEMFEDICSKILVKPLIPKLRRSYALPDGLVLEVNEVDKGEKTEFYYAEIEFATEEQANDWKPKHAHLADYLGKEVTDKKGQSMADYWKKTRE